MKSTHITFSNAEGIPLSAELEWPADQHPHTFAIFAHCFSCTKDFTAIRNISKALAAKGFAVLRFDFTGLGSSEGNFSDSNFSTNVSDLLAAAEFLTREYQSPELLIGHSLGGTAVIQAAASLPNVKALVTIGAPAEATHVEKLFKNQVKQIKKEGSVEVNLGGTPFYVKEQFLEDLKKQSIPQTLAKLRKALLILHAPQDAIVGIENAATLFDAAFHPKSFIALDQADHLLTNKIHSRYAGEVIAAWAYCYVHADEKPLLETEFQTVALTGERSDGFTTLIQAGKHALTADEPEDVGGDDFGPSPYQLLTAALASCTSMTLRMYANKKELDLKQVKVHVNHSKRHCEDCQQTGDVKLDHFDRVIELSGNLSVAQRNRLLEIANKCPVHRTLEGEIQIDTSLL